MKDIRLLLASLVLLFSITTGITTGVSNAKNDEMLGGLKNHGLSTQSTEINPQWVEWAIVTLADTDEFYEFGADWVVPNPPSAGNVVFIGIDLEENSTEKPRALSAVLWWGASSAGGGNYWSFAAWWVEWVGPGQWTYGTIGLGNVVENVAQTGDIMHGELWRNTSNLNNWIVKIWDKTRQTSDEGSREEWTDSTPYTFSSVNLQVPSFASAPSVTKLPSTIRFSNLYLSKQGYVQVNPTWVGGQNYVGYGLEVKHDNTWVTLKTGSSVGSFVNPYGGDPGRDELMGTNDDLDYFPVIDDVITQGISILTVDYQDDANSLDGDYPYNLDAHTNFKTIAQRTGGRYFLAIPSLDTAAVVNDIKNRMGGGRGDVVFTFDLTSSMSNRNKLQDAKVTAQTIIDALVGTDIAFGVGSHVDYPGTYGDNEPNYGYSAEYGKYPDYAWQQDLEITVDSTNAKNVIASLREDLWGGDFPQDYVRVLYESKFFNWRTSTTKIVVMFGDAPAHFAPSGGRPVGVGGIVLPVDKFGLLAPYIGLSSTILVATVATAIYVKRVKRRNEKQ